MILIVDDNQENIFSLKALLELNGFSVDSATSGQEALKRVLKNSYSLIILDVQMPDMDGFEVAEAISGNSKFKDIPIIFLSAINTHKHYIARGYSAGGVDYVTKPIDADILLLKVKTFYRLSEQKRKLLEMDQLLRDEIEFRKKAESDLAQKVEELRSTLESLPHLAFTICKNGNIEFVNNHWLKYSPGTRTFPVAEELRVEDCIHVALETKRQVIREVKIKPLEQKDYRFHRIHLTPIVKDQEVVRWVGVLTDVHEQKTASQVLENKVQERTQELKAINRQLEDRNIELQRFAFIASHDLQEPLRKIQIFSDLVLKKFSNDNASTEKFIHKIIDSAERMRLLIRSLLEYSSLPDKVVYEVADINTIVREVVQDLELDIRAQETRLHLSPIPSFEVIPVQMRQVFHNLISNALKFAKKNESPVINIAAELVQSKAVDAEPAVTGEYCRIVVSDNGIGFDQAYADKVFKIFQRLKQREGDSGAGIGLAIVKKIIDRHAGIISVATREGEGTTFTMVFPVTQKQLLTH